MPRETGAHHEHSGAEDFGGSTAQTPQGKSLGGEVPRFGIVSLPKPTDETSSGSKDIDPKVKHAAGMNNALRAAARLGQPVEGSMVGTGAENSLYVKGKIFRAADGETEGVRTLSQPPGAKAVPVSEEDFQNRVAELPHWRTISIKPSKTTPKDDDAMVHLTLPIHEVLASQTSPYAIRVYGEPINNLPSESGDPNKTLIDDLIGEEQNKWEKARRKKEDNPRYEFLERESAERIQELELGRKNGLWDYRIAVGAATSEDADSLAVKFEIAGGDPGLRYELLADPTPYPTIEKAMGAAAGTKQYVSTELVGRTIPIPVEAPVAGIVQERKLTFSPTLKGAELLKANNPITTGRLLDDYGVKKGELMHPRGVHVLAVGQTGLGKTTFLEHFAEQFIVDGETVPAQEGETQHHVGALIIDPKPESTDYEGLVDTLAEHGKDVTIIRLGEDNAVNVGINPFEPLPGETIKDRKAKALLILSNGFAASGGDDAVAVRAAQLYAKEAIYGYERNGKRVPDIFESMGWHSDVGRSAYEGGDPPYPDMTYFVTRLMEVADEHKYQGEGSNIKEFVGAFADNANQGAAKEFFSGEPLDIAKMRENVTIVKIDKVLDPVARSIICASLVDTIYRDLDGKNPFLFAVEEANVMAPDGSPAGEHFAEMFQQARSRGGTFAIAAQNPSKLAGEIIGNSGTRIAFGLTEPDDQETMRKALGLTEEEARFFTNAEVGIALHKGRGTGDANRVKIDPPIPRPRGTAEAKGPEYVVKNSEGRELYKVNVKDEAELLLRTKEVGKLLTFWTNLAATTRSLGLPPPVPHDEYCEREDVDFQGFNTLRDMATSDDPDQAKILNRAIHQSAKRAVLSRSDFVLHDMPYQDVVAYVEHVIHHSLDHYGSDRPKLPVPPPLKAYTDYPEKLEAMTLVRTSRQLAADRQAVEHEIKQFEEAGDTETIAQLRQEADILDERLADYPHKYNPDKDVVYFLTDDPRMKIVQDLTDKQLKATDHDIADILIPPGKGGYAIDGALGVTIDKTIETGDQQRWRQSLDRVLSNFDLPPDVAKTLMEELDATVEANIKTYKEDKAKETGSRIDALERRVDEASRQLDETRKTAQDAQDIAIHHEHRFEEEYTIEETHTREDPQIDSDPQANTDGK